jgi:hypothetical protein
MHKLSLLTPLYLAAGCCQSIKITFELEFAKFITLVTWFG